MKKRIFIGSSSEQLTTLNEIITLLGESVECIPWTDAFGLNKSGLDSLIKQTKLADFSVLVATKDDLTKQRGESLTKPRDNVVFEFGLFLGAAGSEKCYLIAEEDADLPSDLDGITVAKFTRNPGQYNSLDKIVENIKSQIAKVGEMAQLGLLPSTALAIGYYNSFLKRVCEELHNSGVIEIEGKKLSVKCFKIDVIIPERLDDNGVANFTTLYNKKHKLSKASTTNNTVSQGTRGYPFHFKVDPPDANQENPVEIHLSDIPSTLSTIVDSLKLYLPTNQVGQDFDIDYLEMRELENFAKVLTFLIGRNAATKGFVTVFTNVQL
ncbi:nucleotide-binding protein [Mucilaginibacter sp. 21P]|uniref:CBASS system CD-NTase-associated NAD(+) hydrolase Cap12 n=1 Tax=Mucilaginibacter sp. 21P TaxID=2778902 RepID=UPI001C583261|nr:STING domain-containing protein [Mucilaginibacter sp. 21P]QXV66321.1 nucleotide-binding protein [Mucilaginibacter sp. 21P]